SGRERRAVQLLARHPDVAGVAVAPVLDLGDGAGVALVAEPAERILPAVEAGARVEASHGARQVAARPPAGGEGAAGAVVDHQAQGRLHHQHPGAREMPFFRRAISWSSSASESVRAAAARAAARSWSV